MKSGLVLEGGAMRGMYSAGVTDILMENSVKFDAAVGVSAGAAFGCNYKSNQPGRAVRYNMKYCRDPRYVSLFSLVKTGDLYGADFCYNELPLKLDPFDRQSFRCNPMEFYVVCTDAVTGKAVYHKCADGDYIDMQWIRASASMPVVSRLVPLDGRLLSDGGAADSIPVKWFSSIGYEHCVVILTQPLGYRKPAVSKPMLLRKALSSYPALAETLIDRPRLYNETLDYIAQKEIEGSVLVIRPSTPLLVGKVERNPKKLKDAYETGRCDALARLNEIKSFVEMK